MKATVQNMTSSKGNKIANQFIITSNEGETFQSYNSTIVQITSKGTFLDANFWNYSNTTSKYRNLFLDETSKETAKKIKEGVYKLINLNQ